MAEGCAARRTTRERGRAGMAKACTIRRTGRDRSSAARRMRGRAIVRRA